MSNNNKGIISLFLITIGVLFILIFVIFIYHITASPYHPTTTTTTTTTINPNIPTTTIPKNIVCGNGICETGENISTSYSYCQVDCIKINTTGGGGGGGGGGDGQGTTIVTTTPTTTTTICNNANAISATVYDNQGNPIGTSCSQFSVYVPSSTLQPKTEGLVDIIGKFLLGIVDFFSQVGKP